MLLFLSLLTWTHRETYFSSFCTYSFRQLFFFSFSVSSAFFQFASHIRIVNYVTGSRSKNNIEALRYGLFANAVVVFPRQRLASLSIRSDSVLASSIARGKPVTFTLEAIIFYYVARCGRTPEKEKKNKLYIIHLTWNVIIFFRVEANKL